MKVVFLFLLVMIGFVKLGFCQDSNPAMNSPHKFAWQLFVSITKPANNGTNQVVWETWIDEDDVFRDPQHAPTWPATVTQPLLAQQLGKKFKPITQLSIAQEEEANRIQQLRKRGKKNIQPMFVPPQVGSGEEVRLNRTTFDFIVANNLWYIEGQVDAFNSYLKNGIPLSFPTDAKEIKAIWQRINETQKPRFHWATNPADSNKPYGLVALHVISKDIPNWTWATFEQIDNPERCKVLGCSDSFGVDKSGNLSFDLLKMFGDAGLGAEWKYYRLDGTQLEFTDAQGRPTLLGNSVTEDGFVATSSCMTCHARSTIGRPIPGQVKANRLSVFKSTNPLQSDNGSPNPSWYYKDPKDFSTAQYMQLDFLWSLRNAKHRTQ